MTDAVNKPETKWCGRCRQNLPKQDFAKNSAKKDGLQERCRSCRATHYKDSGYFTQAKEGRLRRKYDLSLAELEQLELSQGSCCAICSNDTFSLVVDHDHKTGKVRGLLCNFCNTGLGLFLDDPERLKSAISYLKGT